MGKYVLTPKLKRTEQENIPTKTKKKREKIGKEALTPAGYL